MYVCGPAGAVASVVTVVSGVVTRMVGRNSCFIQQYDEETDTYYGVYVYGGYNTQAAFGVGNSVVVEGKIGFYSGSLQITDVKAKVHSWADDANPEKDVYILDVADPSVITKENTDLIKKISLFAKKQILVKKAL